MRHTLIALLILLSPVAMLAQHTIYADVGYAPGFSATYNYKLTKHFSAGLGLQGYRLFRPYVGKKFTPGIFADMRINIRPEKNNQFFLMLDLGVNFYKQDKSYYSDSISMYIIPHNNGFYTGLGFGYFRRMTKRGGGPYASLKLVSNSYTFWRYGILSEKLDTGELSLDAVGVFSIGFKF